MLNTISPPNPTDYSYTADHYIPHPRLRNAHLQTNLSYLKAYQSGLQYERVTIDTADGDFLDIDLPKMEGYEHVTSDPKALVIVVPGFYGDTRKVSSPGYHKLLIETGITPIGFNFRGRSGRENNNPWMPHLSITLQDLKAVVSWVKNEYPDLPIGISGCSVGAMMTINFLADPEFKLDAATCVSPAFNANKAADKFSATAIYNSWVTNIFKLSIVRNPKKFQGLIDVKQALKAKTVPELDAVCIPFFIGDISVEDYYAKVSCDHLLPKITTPTLIIRSIDDPFWDPTDVPYDALDENPFITPMITEFGGHLGFYCTLSDPYNWSTYKSVQFFKQTLLA